MTEAQYNLFLSVAAWLSALGAIFNLLRLKSRGNSALLLSAAFLTMGGLFWLIKSHAAQPLVIGAGILLGAFLIGDFILRSAQQQEKNP